MEVRRNDEGRSATPEIVFIAGLLPDSVEDRIDTSTVFEA